MTQPEPPDGSVWEEPALSPELAGPVPPQASTYGKWLRQARERTPAWRTWMVTAALAILAGPWAVLGAFLGLGRASAGLLMVVVFGPVMEEVLKVSAALVVVERRPYLFSSAGQVAVCAFASGVVFAAIENVLYLRVYIPDPDPGIILWRWTACVVLHSGCSLLAGLGVAKVWRDVWERLDRPRIHLVFPNLILAAVVHGSYNALATVWALVREG